MSFYTCQYTHFDITQTILTLSSYAIKQLSINSGLTLAIQPTAPHTGYAKIGNVQRIRTVYLLCLSIVGCDIEIDGEIILLQAKSMTQIRVKKSSFSTVWTIQYFAPSNRS